MMMMIVPSFLVLLLLAKLRKVRAFYAQFAISYHSSDRGVVFGPKPRDYSKKINTKVKSLAFSRALFDRASAGEIAVIEAFDLRN